MNFPTVEKQKQYKAEFNRHEVSFA